MPNQPFWIRLDSAFRKAGINPAAITSGSVRIEPLGSMFIVIGEARLILTPDQLGELVGDDEG